MKVVLFSLLAAIFILITIYLNKIILKIIKNKEIEKKVPNDHPMYDLINKKIHDSMYIKNIQILRRETGNRGNLRNLLPDYLINIKDEHELRECLFKWGSFGANSKHNFFYSKMRGINQFGKIYFDVPVDSLDRNKINYSEIISNEHKDGMFIKTWKDLEDNLFKNDFDLLFTYLYYNSDLLYHIENEYEFKALLKMFFQVGERKVFYKYNKHITIFDTYFKV